MSAPPPPLGAMTLQSVIQCLVTSGALAEESASKLLSFARQRQLDPTLPGTDRREVVCLIEDGVQNDILSHPEGESLLSAWSRSHPQQGSADGSIRRTQPLMVARIFSHTSPALGDGGAPSSVEVDETDPVPWEGPSRIGYTPLLLDAPPDPTKTFETFVTSRSNEFTIEVARAVAGGGDARYAYNPLYIYGESGLGKTHILSAVANASADTAVLINLADLQAELERSTRMRRSAELRRWIEQFDILLLDDIQLCEGNTSLQREIFALTNHRARARRTVVITSDVPPTRLADVESRLLARLGAGVIVTLQMGDPASRQEILRRWFHDRHVSTQVIEYLASQVDDSVRRLEAAARQLLAIADHTDVEISLDLARAVVPLPADLTHRPTPPLRPESAVLPMTGSPQREPIPHQQRALQFKTMLEGAESEAEQVLALQIALGERIRELREVNGNHPSLSSLERALSLLRQGEMDEAIRCLAL